MTIFTAFASAALLFAHPMAAPGAELAKPSPQSVDDKAVVATVDGFHAALGRGDRRAAAELLAQDALIYESGGVERTKAEYEQHHLPADATFAQTVTRSITRRAVSTNGNLAWTATEAAVKGSYKGRAINSVSTETMILRRDRGRWRIVHVHWSSADVK